MTDPFKIEGPALISFSGGRTSGYMLHRILEAHGGQLPPDVIVAFANTGREREETLRFVYECGARWGVQVHWLEFLTDLKAVTPAERFEVVGFNSASRNGEPLDRLIARKKALFSTISGRWCTDFAKVRTLSDFMSTLGYEQGQYVEVIGFRADEYDRVVELPRKPRNAGRVFSFPLAKAGIRKADVEAFWKAQPFDLGLRKGSGNCDHCPFLGWKTRVARARLNPDGLDWWAGYEEAKGFAFGEMSIAQLRQHIAENPLLFPLDDLEDDEGDIDCIGGCE